MTKRKSKAFTKNRLQNFSVRTKLLLGFGVIMILFFAISFFNVIVANQVNGLKSVELPMEQNLREVEVGIWEMIHAADSFRLTGNEFYEELYNEQVKNVDDFFANYATLTDTDTESAFISEFNSVFKEAVMAGNTMVELTKKQKTLEGELFINVDEADDVIDFEIQAEWSSSDPYLLEKEQSVREVEVSIWEAIHAATQFVGLSSDIVRGEQKYLGDELAAASRGAKASLVKGDFSDLMERQFQDVEEYWAKYKELPHDQQEEENILLFESYWEKAVESGRELIETQKLAETQFNLLFDKIDQTDEIIDSKMQTFIQERIDNEEQKASGLEFSSLTLSALSLLIIIIIFYFIYYPLSKAIQKLVTAARNISKGDFDVQIKQVPKDEIGEVADSFNTMSARLKDFYSELEKKVKQKTSQLKKEKENMETEKAKAETFISSLGEGVMAFDTEGRIITMNKAAEEIFGLSLKNVLYKPAPDHIPLKDKDGTLLEPGKPPLHEVVPKRKPVYLPAYFTDKDGNKRILGMTIAPVISGKKVLGVIGTFRDITKEREIEQSKTDFISLASHQLRTPLTSIKWILQEAYQMDNIKVWKEEYLKDAVKSTERMISLVHDLLNVSRLEGGDIAVTPEDVDMVELVEDIVKTEAIPVAEDKKQHIDFKKPSKKIMVFTDRQLIRQVISNLVSNAIRYSDSGKTVKIRMDKKDDYISISVADQGIGIPEKDHKHLFEKFYRTKEAAKYSTTGSGLGLYIIKRILDACYGTISVNSKKGKGSTFTFTLPKKAPISKTTGRELFEHIIS